MHKALLPVILLVHALLISIADHLPDPLAAAIAGTVYLPLWPLSALGLPVHARADAWGWSSPSLLGWGVIALTWTTVWAAVVAGLARLRR